MTHDIFHSWIMFAGIVMFCISLFGIIVPITAKIFANDMFGKENPPKYGRLIFIGFITFLLSLIITFVNIWLSNGFVFRIF